MTLRVAYLLPRLLSHESGAVVGGCAVNCLSLASALSDEGVCVELLTTTPKTNLENLTSQPWASYVRALPEVGRRPIGKGLCTIHVLSRGLKKTLHKRHFDVVHAHSGTYPYAILPLMADSRTCVRLHSLYCPFGARGGVYSRWWEQRSVARALFGRLDRVIAVTDNVRQSVERAGVRPEKIELVPMCVDTQRFRPRTLNGRSRYFPSDHFQTRILFIGNASKQKGLVELLHAMKILTDECIPFFLVAAIENQSKIREYSDGYRRVHELVDRLAIGEHVRLLGLVDHIEDLYAESDVLVVPWKTSRGPSDYPMVALEAMASGKCVIATPVGGCSELLRHGKAGFLTEGCSAGDIAATIRYVRGDIAMRRTVEQAAVARAKGLSMRRSGRRMIELYERLLSVKNHHD